jgi:hypothetical protein
MKIRRVERVFFGNPTRREQEERELASQMLVVT